MLANQGGLEPFFDQPLARPRDRVDTGLQRRRDLAVAPALTTVRGVGFQQDPGLQQLLCWMVSAMDQGGEMLSLLIAQCHYVFLYRDLFPTEGITVDTGMILIGCPNVSDARLKRRIP